MRPARFGDNMRYVAVTEGDTTEAELRLGVQVNTWSVNDLVAAVDAAPDSAVDALVGEYLDLYDVVPALAPGGERRRAPTPSKTSAASDSPRTRGATAHGRRLRVRRGGRLEDRGARAHRGRHGRAAYHRLAQAL